MYSSDNSYDIELNPIWSFESAASHFGSQSPGTLFGNRAYGIVSVTFKRASTGMVLRLALPIFLLVFLAALAFWASPSDRVDATVTMLIAISALYVMVIQNIPMIGTFLNSTLLIVRG